MRKKQMSQYEYKQASKMIHDCYDNFGQGLDFEECYSASWVAYLEVRERVSNIYNTDTLWVEARPQIIEVIKNIRKIRNDKMRMESRLSLNQTLGESDEPVYTFLFPVHGDFVNGICLWDYIDGLGGKKAKILHLLYQGEDDISIMDRLQLKIFEYYDLIIEIKGDLMVYMEIEQD